MVSFVPLDLRKESRYFLYLLCTLVCVSCVHCSHAKYETLLWNFQVTVSQPTLACEIVNLFKPLFRGGKKGKEMGGGRYLDDRLLTLFNPCT